ncbi:RNA polymerase sigma factor [Mucilaginibacter dorajii]|uniref:RNA polymerase sigma-70 region 2 domain-containing protein n=1 Tax=Mucilaginibacter dorajii TaxID=692994 RepID=A0ABP7QZS7_9SPHI|nr:hypothetical protein [Mucilaginibacter dorajii]MCS3732235.1 DNA-directed RNA polymerase specialized sigma24 family protein [Mucilaginibacter dorajii]
MTVYTNLNDQQIVALVKQSDEIAYQDVYLRYNKLLFLFAYRKLRDKEEAREVVQGIFVWLWNKEGFELSP